MPLGTARLPIPKCIRNETLLRSKCIVDQNIARSAWLILALKNEMTTTRAHFRTFSRNIPDRKHELAISRTSQSQEVLFPLICLTIIITAL